jgi:hypothetical protein
MGLDIDPHGQLSVVSDAHTLDLSNIPKEGCANFREIYGAEDPRLFWTVSDFILT